MSASKTGGCAFPIAYEMGSELALEVRVAHGMTLRDYFAAKALSGLISACSNDAQREGLGDPEHVAACAYGIADAMLKARQQ